MLVFEKANGKQIRITTRQHFLLFARNYMYDYQTFRESLDFEGERYEMKP